METSPPVTRSSVPRRQESSLSYTKIVASFQIMHKTRPIVILASLFAAAVIGHAEEVPEYDPTSKVLDKAPILVSGVKGDVTFVKIALNAPNTPGTPAALSDGERIYQGTVVTTGDDSRVDLIFSNGAVLALDEHTVLRVREFLQAGGFDIEPPITDGKTIVDHTIPRIGEIDKEPSHSMTRLFLEKGNMYARVKKLHKRSKYKVETALGRTQILGTTWRQTVTVDREKLEKHVDILLHEGLIEFKPIDSIDHKNPAITIHPNHRLEITGVFQSLAEMQANVDSVTSVQVEVDIAVAGTLIRDPEFPALLQTFLPEQREEQIVPRAPEVAENADMFSGDQGITGAPMDFGGSGGGGGGNTEIGPTPLPTPRPQPTPAS